MRMRTRARCVLSSPAKAGGGGLHLRVRAELRERRHKVFVIVCRHCWKNTKYDALDVVSGLPCDKCGEIL
jgi:hypothetical protein